MKRLIAGTVLAAVLAVAAASPSSARTTIVLNVGSGTPSTVYFPDSPAFVQVPGTRVYYVGSDSPGYTMYRYGGMYYVTDNGTWYRSNRIAGPYRVVEYRTLPRPMVTAVTTHSRHGKVKMKHKVHRY